MCSYRLFTSLFLSLFLPFSSFSFFLFFFQSCVFVVFYYALGSVLVHGVADVVVEYACVCEGWGLNVCV